MSSREINHPFSTLAVHGGMEVDKVTGAILTPIVQSTTYVMDAVGENKGFTYSRADNPTVAVLERAIGAFEGSLPAVAFGTGMGAIHALFFGLLRSGDHVVCGDVVYGGTVRLLRQFFAGFGIESTFVDTSDLNATEAAIRPTTKIVIVETPANPTMKLTDVAAVSKIAHAHGGLLAVDNTFLTPIGMRCFDLGADITIYSTTKYMEGHDATVGGALCTNDPALRERFALTRKSVGSIQKPQEAWLTLRGLKTLPLRLRAHAQGAQQVAEWLEAQDAVTSVAYPGLPSFKQYELARRQHLENCGMLCFELRGGIEAGIQFMNSVKLCSLAENLGAAETLITHPVTMTHGDVPREQRESCGITDGLIRLSVGLENPDDILADLAQALQQVESRLG